MAKKTKLNPSRIEKIKKWYRGLPDKKRYLELVTAFLSIPVLLTVLINNTNNIKSQRNGASLTPTPASLTVTEPVHSPAPLDTKVDEIGPTPPADNAATLSPTPQTECIKGIGPVSIEYPQENDVITGDPVCVNITRQSSDYCSIVWSYRLNGGTWSDFLDKSFCMYGLTSGTKQLQVKIRSVPTNEEATLTRNFSISGPTATPTATDSGAL